MYSGKEIIIPYTLTSSETLTFLTATLVLNEPLSKQPLFVTAPPAFQ